MSKKGTRLCTVIRDTVKGISDTPVRVGTVVRILATRQDPDGLKLLVQDISRRRNAYQLSQEDTDFKAATLQEEKR